jgi:serine/threonine-protein kinase
LVGPLDENAEANAFVGKTLAGKYRIDGVIGVGGMGFVLAATHLHIDEPVAVKLLYTSFATNQEIVKRFIREAKAARKIKSEHVVRVLDVDTLENGVPYIVMEHLQGQDLEAILRRMGRQPIATALDVILQATEALAEAHVQKMVHRDLKPANLFVTKRPDGDALVKVLDFGISKVTGTGGADLNVTQAGDAILGSPQYMAPEQLKSLKDVDARTDIWALGSILYEMLSGNPPFNAASLPELCTAILEHPPPSLRAIRPDVSPGLESVIVACLAKERDGRPSNVATLASALAPFCPPAVQASAARIAGVFRTARFDRAGGGSTVAMSTVSAAQFAAARAAAAAVASPPSDTAPVSPPAPRISSPPSTQHPASTPPPKNQQPVMVGNASTGNAFTKDRVSGRPPPPPSSSQTGLAAAVVGIAAVVIGLVVVFVALPWARSHRSGTAPSALATTSSTPPPPVSESAEPPTPPPSESVAAPPPPIVDAAAAPSASTAPTAKPVPQVDCSTPFTVDADGIKRWKRGCVR